MVGRQIEQGSYRLSLAEKIAEVLSQRQRQRIDATGLASAAVLVPLYHKRGEYHLLFTKRTEEVDYHKGQICFPGGGRHIEDETLLDTALRETCEELGIHPQDIKVLGELDELSTISSKYAISPFVGLIPYPYPFKPNRREVAELMEVPIAALLEEGNSWQEVQASQGGPVTVYFYKYEGQVIWGATAKMLKQFLDLVFS
jgi:8-oxo-dGTP pyrophosphatase MutT (NUDIX family)